MSLTWFSLLLRVDSTTPGGAGRESDGGPPTDRAWCGSQQTRCRLLDPSPRSLRGGSRRYYKVQLPPTSFVTFHYVITWDHGLNMFPAPLVCPTSATSWGFPWMKPQNRRPLVHSVWLVWLCYLLMSRTKHLYGDTRFSGGGLQNRGLIGLSPLGREKRLVIVTYGLGHSNRLCVMAGMAR